VWLQLPFVAVRGLPFKHGRAAALSPPLYGWLKVRVAAAIRRPLRAWASRAASIAGGFVLRGRDDESDAPWVRKMLGATG